MNPQILYNKLISKEITKDDFVYHLRRDIRLSESINNLMSFNDIVNVLKNKGMILEEETDNIQSVYDDIIDKIMDMPTSDSQSRKDFIDNYLMLNKVTLDSDQRSDLDFMISNALKSTHGTEELPDEDDMYDEEDYNYYLENKSLTTEGKKSQKLKGGKGDKLTADQVNPYEYKRGWKHELEHTDDIDKAKEIALDHLAEDPMYYSRLDAMEKKVKTRTDLHTELSKKKDNLKDEGNAMVYYTKDKLKANTDTDLGEKEKGTKKPKGVDTMTMNSKTVRGIKKMALPGKEKKIKSLTEMLEDKIDYIDSIINEEIEVSSVKNNQYYRLTAGIGAIPARTIVRIEKDDFGDEYSLTIFGEDGTTETMVVPTTSTLPVSDVKAPEDKMDESNYDFSRGAHDNVMPKTYSEDDKEYAQDVINLLTSRSDFTSIMPQYNISTLNNKIKDITKGKYGIFDIIQINKSNNPVKLANSIFDLIKKSGVNEEETMNKTPEARRTDKEYKEYLQAKKNEIDKELRR